MTCILINQYQDYYDYVQGPSDKTEVHLLQQLQSESKAQSILYGRAVGTCHHILS